MYQSMVSRKENSGLTSHGAINIATDVLDGDDCDIRLASARRSSNIESKMIPQ
jgi:hypothetical protein